MQDAARVTEGATSCNCYLFSSAMASPVSHYTDSFLDDDFDIPNFYGNSNRNNGVSHHRSNHVRVFPYAK
jgi:hypothetical protein